jgi:hypothetical protein
MEGNVFLKSTGGGSYCCFLNYFNERSEKKTNIQHKKATYLSKTRVVSIDLEDKWLRWTPG